MTDRTLAYGTSSSTTDLTASIWPSRKSLITNWLRRTPSAADWIAFFFFFHRGIAWLSLVLENGDSRAAPTCAAAGRYRTMNVQSQECFCAVRLTEFRASMLVATRSILCVEVAVCMNNYKCCKTLTLKLWHFRKKWTLFVGGARLTPAWGPVRGGTFRGACAFAYRTVRSRDKTPGHAGHLASGWRLPPACGPRGGPAP